MRTAQYERASAASLRFSHLAIGRLCAANARANPAVARDALVETVTRGEPKLIEAD